MRIFRLLRKFGFVGGLLLVALGAYARGAAGQAAKPATAAPRVVDSAQELGVFEIGGARYGVLARVKSISGGGDPKLTVTVSELEILGSTGTLVYRKGFSADLQGGRFARTLSASASSLQGAGGAALVIRILEEPAAAGEGESWLVFAMVGGKLTALGVPLPPGQGTGLAVGGVVAGVMVGGGVNVMPLASKAEALEFRAWTGNFFVFVPVRLDWEQGQWGEGENCFALDKGSLTKTGCNMRIDAAARPYADGLVITLYAEPVVDRYHASPMQIVSGAKFEILTARAIVNWKEVAGRVRCSFDDVWLQVRVNGDLGWVHSGADFTAVGLPSGSAPE